MKLGGLLRMRFAMALALCAVLWSDPSFAALICRAPQCSLDAMQSRQQPPAAARSVGLATNRLSDATPCCPMHARHPKGASDELSCCNIDRAASLTQAASERPRSKRIVAAASRQNPAAPPLADSPPPTSQAAALYVKPVDQKKTDLRI